jgi:Tfp pilus assembly protein PilV
MVALLLFSFGTLGIARLQLGAAQATRDASDAAVALMLAEDLAQRVLLGEPEQALLHEQGALPGARACVARDDAMWRLAVFWEARAGSGAPEGDEVPAPAESVCSPSNEAAALHSVRLLLPHEVSL